VRSSCGMQVHLPSERVDLLPGGPVTCDTCELRPTFAGGKLPKMEDDEGTALAQSCFRS
jgi:hypothetical protein